MSATMPIFVNFCKLTIVIVLILFCTGFYGIIVYIVQARYFLPSIRAINTLEAFSFSALFALLHKQSLCYYHKKFKYIENRCIFAINFSYLRHICQTFCDMYHLSPLPLRLKARYAPKTYT